MPGHVPCQQHTHNVGAHDHQHEDYRGKKCKDRVAESVSDPWAFERNYRSSPSEVRLGALCRDTRCNRIHDGLRLLEGKTWIKASHHAQVAMLMICPVSRAKGEGSPHLRVSCWKLKILGSYSNNPVQLAVESDRLPKYLRIGCEMTSPVLMAQYHRLSFVRIESSSEERVDAKHLE